MGFEGESLQAELIQTVTREELKVAASSILMKKGIVEKPIDLYFK